MHHATSQGQDPEGNAARGMSNTKELRRRRSNLMKRNPHCHWCGRKLVYFHIENGIQPPDFATIDHINSRLIYPDGRPRVGKQVLSCPGCNQDRNKEEQKSLGAEELTRRAQAGRLYSNSASTMSSSLSEFSIPAAQSGERREPIALARSENKALARSI